MKHGIIVYNPTAGRFPSQMLCERAATVLSNRGWSMTLERTRSGEHVTELAMLAVSQGMDAFFVAGGDGSLNQAIIGLIGSRTALGVLPCGTANVWAQELGLPGLSWTRWLALEESARLLSDAQVKMVDIGICNHRPFLLWAGVGLDAFVVHRIEPRSRWEKHFAFIQYATSVVWHTSYWHGVNLRVKINDNEISGHFLLALVSNIHLYAGGLAQLSPNARLDDGIMDLWLFEGDTLGDTVQLAIELFSGSHVLSKRVQHYSFHHLEVLSESQTYTQVDGEPHGVGESVIIDVEKEQLAALIPENIPRSLF
jgi:diacylglycerol kinase (ATP)